MIEILIEKLLKIIVATIIIAAIPVVFYISAIVYMKLAELFVFLLEIVVDVYVFVLEIVLDIFAFLFEYNTEIKILAFIGSLLLLFLDFMGFLNGFGSVILEILKFYMVNF